MQSAKRDSAVDVSGEQRNEPPKFGFPKIGAADYPLISLFRPPPEKNIAVDALFEVFLMESLGNMTG
jgi:hypothetical protein